MTGWQTALASAIASLTDEITAAFDWLTADIDLQMPVTFVPNPGNVGDAAINLACFDYLKARFDRVEIRSVVEAPRTECVFVGGGGNLVEPLYVRVRDFLDGLPTGHRLFMFPATLHGYSNSLRRIAPFARILCRERRSLAYACTLLDAENISLSHDAAFLLAGRLRNEFASRLEKPLTAKCRLFRKDQESTHSEPGGLDVMLLHQGDWTDMELAWSNVTVAARYLLGFGEVETDRLHAAILAAILGRRTVLRANSYFKNAAVFEHSLSRLPETAFLPTG
jgi:exopolysaccharide biosynthesis predicted pyruvyltransferase EpsI